MGLKFNTNRFFAVGTVVLVMAFMPPAARAQSIAQMSPKPIATGAVPLPVLRRQAEAEYRKVRDALSNKDYDGFLRLVIPAGTGKPPPREAFDQIALRLLDNYPVLESLDFVKIDRSGDWIGYYAEDRVMDPQRTYIFFFRFKRTGPGLKMSGRVVVKDIAREKGQIATQNEIDLDPRFRLPGQKGYKE